MDCPRPETANVFSILRRCPGRTEVRAPGPPAQSPGAAVARVEEKEPAVARTLPMRRAAADSPGWNKRTLPDQCLAAPRHGEASTFPVHALTAWRRAIVQCEGRKGRRFGSADFAF